MHVATEVLPSGRRVNLTAQAWKEAVAVRHCTDTSIHAFAFSSDFGEWLLSSQTLQPPGYIIISAYIIDMKKAPWVPSLQRTRTSPQSGAIRTDTDKSLADRRHIQVSGE